MTRSIPAALLLACCFCALAAPLRAQDQPNGADTTTIYSADAVDTVALKRIRKLLTGAPYWTNTSVTATADGYAVLPARATRRRVGWVNTSTQDTVYISSVPGSTGAVGITVPPGATGGMNTTAALYVHSAGGAARVDLAETYD